MPTISLGTGIYVDPNTTGDFRSLAITTVVALAALPWVAGRRRGVFGPVSDNSAARVVRVGGCAAICVLVLVLARLAQTLGENLADGEYAEVIITPLTVILVVAARLWLRRPGKTATPELRALLTLGLGAAVLILFFFVGTTELITAYAAGILAVTARGSRIAPATLVFGAAGVAAGLIWYAVARTGNHWLILVVVAVFAAPTAAGAAAAWRTPGGMTQRRSGAIVCARAWRPAR